MKKLSQIDEGFWKDGIKRSKSGEQREEDKHHTNIEELKPVDIGVEFYFADVDFCDAGEFYFNHEDMLNYKDFFAKYGWRVPDYNDFQSIDFGNKKVFRWRPDMKTSNTYVYNVYHHNPKSDDLDEVYFETEQNKPWEGWMLYDERSLSIMEYFWKTHYKTGATFGQMSHNPSHTRRIRLIKDKK